MKRRIEMVNNVMIEKGKNLLAGDGSGRGRDDIETEETDNGVNYVCEKQEKKPETIEETMTAGVWRSGKRQRQWKRRGIRKTA